MAETGGRALATIEHKPRQKRGRKAGGHNPKFGNVIYWDDEERDFVRGLLQHADPHRAFREANIDQGKSTLTDAVRRFMLRPHIAHFLAEANAKLAAHLTVNAEKVLEELAKIGFFNVARIMRLQDDGTSYVDVSLMEAHDAAAIQEITSEVFLDWDSGAIDNETGKPIPRPVRRLKVKLAPKTPALELMGRHLKMWTDKLEVSDTADQTGKIAESRRLAARLIERSRDGGRSRRA